MKSKTVPRNRIAAGSPARLDAAGQPGEGHEASGVVQAPAAQRVRAATNGDSVLYQVLRTPTKAEVKAAVEQLFKVEVLSVATTAKTKSKAGQVLRRKTYSQVLKPTLAPRHVAREDLQAAVQSLAA